MFVLEIAITVEAEILNANVMISFNIETLDYIVLTTG